MDIMDRSRPRLLLRPHFESTLAVLCRLRRMKSPPTLVSRTLTVKSTATLLLAFALCFCPGCHPGFQGGRLTKWRGPFFSTNYFAEFQELDLNHDGRYTITFSGFPRSPAYLDLSLVMGNDEKFIRQFTSEITMELNNADGTPVCTATGKLNQHQGGDHTWILARGGEEASFWNSDCLWLKIRRDQAYTLKIAVRGSNPALGPLRARPIIWTPHD
jgi:hypothetical protein